jgi:large subunit ribosomal protein L13
MKTYSAKPHEVDQNWLLVDAEGQTLGRMATAIATRLRGKHKAEYTPHVDTGDYVVVINAGKVKVTGNKATDKLYHSHSGFPGALKSISFERLIKKSPEKVIKLAVKGMLPRSRLGRAMFRKLKVYAGTEHPHGAQQPQTIQLQRG